MTIWEEAFYYLSAPEDDLTYESSFYLIRSASEDFFDVPWVDLNDKYLKNSTQLRWIYDNHKEDVDKFIIKRRLQK